MKIHNKHIESLFKPSDEQINVPYIIAEAGVNHEGNIELAKRLIDEAKEGGADSIKFQSYKAETLVVEEAKAYWDQRKEGTASQFNLFKKYDVFWKSEYEQLKKYCDKAGILFLSTPFDIESAIFLNDLMPLFKISSSDITNKPFIEFICCFNKPIILSTGASNIDEIDSAVNWITTKKQTLALLHCILNYPTQNKFANLAMIQGLKKRYPEFVIGYSDHTLPEDMQTLHIAWLLGAKILEKHFTFDKKLKGNDHYHAMDKDDLIQFRRIIKDTYLKLGDSQKIALESEEQSREQARRSIVVSQSLKKGQELTSEHLTYKRPGTGICPSEIDKVIGKVLVQNIDTNHILQWTDVK